MCVQTKQSNFEQIKGTVHYLTLFTRSSTLLVCDYHCGIHNIVTSCFIKLSLTLFH
uniref:Uncharacterized protein n=1 Tax=Rhizophora mucronata TaxID=61149 RepID=A0A2P2N551_RHIMU